MREHERRKAEYMKQRMQLVKSPSKSQLSFQFAIQHYFEADF